MGALESVLSVFDLIQDAMIIVDESHTIRYINDSALGTFAYHRDELVGQSISLLIPNRFHPSHSEVMGKYMGCPRSRLMNTGQRLAAMKSNGDELPVSISLTPIASEADETTYVCAILRDLSEMVSIEKRLIQRQKMEALGVIAGGVAHDVNNIMTAIRGSIYLAKKKPDRIDKYLSNIENQCGYAADIVRQLMMLSMPDNVDKCIFSMIGFLHESKPLLDVTVSDRVNLEFDISEKKEACVLSSPTLIKRALMNLLGNANDACEGMEHPKISLQLSMVGKVNKHDDFNYLCLVVSDNGCGIDKKNLKRIYEPFFTTKEPTKGTGLGLAVVFNVAKVSGGFVEVESQLGVGTTFKLYLPMVEPFVHPAQDNGLHSLQLEEVDYDSIGILLAEPHKETRKVHRDIIESLGYNTFSTKNIDTTVKKAIVFSDEIQLIMMGLSMSEKDAVTAALKIRQDQNKSPIIFYTVNNKPLDLVQKNAKKIYPFTVISEPFNIEELDRAIRRLLSDG